MLLLAAWELVFDLVNYDKLEMDFFRDGTVMFQNDAQRRLFHVLFADFLSSPKYEAFRPGMVAKEKYENFPQLLRKVCDKPLLSIEVNSLKCAVENLERLLGETFILKDMWLATMEIHTTLRIKPQTLFSACGNHVKHSFSRMEGDAKKIVDVFKENGITLETDDIFMIFPELLDWFLIVYFQNEKSLVYALNELRWGLYDYVKAEFDRSFFWKDTVNGIKLYGYKVPDECKSKLGSHCYWELMNSVRHVPRFPEFGKRVAPKLIFEFGGQTSD
jgi:hypothetical protein